MMLWIMFMYPKARKLPKHKAFESDNDLMLLFGLQK